MKNHNKQLSLLPLLFSVNTGALLVANIIANKQFTLFGFALPCAVLVFPITYIASDVFSEVYGYAWSRRSAWAGFAMNLFAVLAFQITLWLPGVPWFNAQEAFEAVLGNTPRILAASLVSFMAGDWVNDIVFREMKKADTSGNKFALRAILSSFCGQLTDSVIFIPAAFAGTMPVSQMLLMIAVQPLAKLLLEFVLLPLTKWCVKLVDSYENSEVI